MKSNDLSIFLFGLFVSSSLALCSTNAAENVEYPTSLLRQQDFKDLLLQSYVLGDRKKLKTDDGTEYLVYSGLFLEQKNQLQKLEELVDLSLASNSSQLSDLISRQISLVLKPDMAMINWVYEFELKIASDKKQIPFLYDQAISNLPSNKPKTFNAVADTLRAEVDSKLFQIRYPLIANYVSETERFLIDEQTGKRRIVEKFPLSNTQLLVRMKTGKPISPTIEKLCMLIFENATKAPWSPHWDAAMSAAQIVTPPVTGILWASAKYSEKWPGLDLDSEPLASAEGFSFAVERAQIEIDSLVQHDFENADDRFHFFKAQAQILHERWSDLGVDDFDYFRLNDEQKNLLSARIFPDLNLKLGRALFELKFFELSEFEQSTLTQQIYSSPEELIQHAARYLKINSRDPSHISKFHEILVSDYLESREHKTFPIQDLAKHTLMNGEKVWDVEMKREEKQRELMKEFKKPSILNSFKDWATVKFNPYDQFWSDEGARFMDEWQRRILIDQFRNKETKFNHAKEKLDRARSDVEKIAAQRELDAATEERNTLAKTLIDSRASDSHAPSVFVASFASGLAPQNANEWISVAKVTGIGAGCYIISRYVGGKIVLTVLGIFGIKEMYRVGSQWMQAQHIEDELDAMESIGELTQGFITFGVGSAVAHSRLDFSRISRMRRLDSYQVKIEKLNKLIDENKAELARLPSVIDGLIHRRNVEEIRFGKTTKTFIELTTEISRTQARMTQLGSGLITGYQSSLEFYMKRTAIEFGRLASTVLNLISIPIKKSLPEVRMSPKRFIDRFKRSEYFGIAQYEEAILKLQRLQEKEGMKAFKLEAAPKISADPRTALKRLAFSRSFSKYKTSQQRISSELAKAETAAQVARARWTDEAQRSLTDEGVRNLKSKTLGDLSTFASSLKKAVREFGEHTRDAKDLSTLLNGSLKELELLQKLHEAKTSLPRSQSFLMKAEELRQWVTMSREHAKNFKWEKTGDAYTKRFFAENYSRLQMQLSDLEGLRAGVERDMRMGKLPLATTLFDSIADLELQIAANRSALKTLWPQFQNYK